MRSNEHDDSLERRFNAWAPASCRQQIDEDDDDYLSAGVSGRAGQHAGQSRTAERQCHRPAGPSEPGVTTIDATMSDGMRFTPDHIDVKTGETVRFVLQTQGKLHHELVFGEPDASRRHAAMMPMMPMMPEMQHSGPNLTSLAPGERGELIWKLTRTRSVAFACLQSGRVEAGMKGAVAVH